MPDFIPGREPELVTWSTNFDQKINAAAVSYGLTVAQASAYTAKHTAWLSSYQAANNPDTRSPSKVIAKDSAKTALISEARMLARIVQATPTVTPEQKSDLGLTVRDVEPSPQPIPPFAPTVVALSSTGYTARVRMIDPNNPTKRGKPDFVDGIAVFSFVGDEAPTTEAAWKFEGNMTRTTVDVQFPSTTASGAKVWFTAFYFNEKKQSGPAATPVSINLPGGGAMAA